MATLYCNYSYQKEQTLENLLASVLKQLAEQAPMLPEAVIDLYKQHRDGQAKLVLQHVTDALRTVIRSSSRVFMLIDALDESPVTQQLMQTMFSFQNRSTMSILVTSRFVPSIVQLFDCIPTLEIRASAEDVQMYLESQMPHLPNFVNRNSTLRKQIRDVIVESSDGMYVIYSQIHFSCTSTDREI